MVVYMLWWENKKSQASSRMRGGGKLLWEPHGLVWNSGALSRKQLLLGHGKMAKWPIQKDSMASFSHAFRFSNFTVHLAAGCSSIDGRLNLAPCRKKSGQWRLESKAKVAVGFPAEHIQPICNVNDSMMWLNPVWALYAVIFHTCCKTIYIITYSLKHKPSLNISYTGCGHSFCVNSHLPTIKQQVLVGHFRSLLGVARPCAPSQQLSSKRTRMQLSVGQSFFSGCVELKPKHWSTFWPIRIETNHWQLNFRSSVGSKNMFFWGAFFFFITSSLASPDWNFGHRVFSGCPERCCRASRCNRSECTHRLGPLVGSRQVGVMLGWFFEANQHKTSLNVWKINAISEFCFVLACRCYPTVLGSRRVF